MAKFALRIRARQLRKKGISVREIARELNISKSTVSLWVRDIILSIQQLEQLKQQLIKGRERGRIIGALIQKERRLQHENEQNKLGRETFTSLSDREFLVAGLALYWAEGNKKKRDVSFCNSDPLLIRFMINWLEKYLEITYSDLFCYVGINEIHREREEKVKKYWSDTTGICLAQFRKTSLKRVKNKKVYENFNNHFGTLTVGVLRPSRFYYKIMGLIHGLARVGSEFVNNDLPT